MNTIDTTINAQAERANRILNNRFTRDELVAHDKVYAPFDNEARAYTLGLCNLLKQMCALGTQNDERLDALECTVAPHGHGVTITVSNPDKDKAIRYLAVGTNSTYHSGIIFINGEEQKSHELPDNLTKVTARAHGRKIGAAALEYLLE